MSRDKIEKWDEVNGITAPERSLEAFLESSTDTYAILQLRDSEDTRYERFLSYNALQRQGKEPEIDHYDVVYLAPEAKGYEFRGAINRDMDLKNVLAIVEKTSNVIFDINGRTIKVTIKSK